MSELNDNPEGLAETLGLRVAVPRKNVLALDTDVPFSMWTDLVVPKETRINLVRNSLANAQFCRLSFVHASKSKSGRVHLWYRAEFIPRKDLPPMSGFLDHERLIIQAAMGSDPVREVLSLARIWEAAGDKIVQRKPSLMFETPEEYETLRKLDLIEEEP